MKMFEVWISDPVSQFWPDTILNGIFSNKRREMLKRRGGEMREEIGERERQTKKENERERQSC